MATRAPHTVGNIRYLIAPDQPAISAGRAMSQRNRTQRKLLRGRHANNFVVWPYGGGLVHVDALPYVRVGAFIGLRVIVDATGRVGKNACIYGDAYIEGTVMGRSKVYDFAHVQQGGRVDNLAEVGGHAIVGWRCVAGDRVKLSGWTWLQESVTLGGNGIFHGRQLSAFEMKIEVEGGPAAIEAQDKKWRRSQVATPLVLRGGMRIADSAQVVFDKVSQIFHYNEVHRRQT